MSNRLTARHSRRALPALVLLVMTAAFSLAAVAGAEDPPIVSAGPVTVGGNSATGTVGSDGDADACISDDHSGADASDTNPVQLNDSNCTTGAGSGGGGGGGTQGTGTQGGGQGSGGSRPSGSSATGSSSGSSATGGSSASVAAGQAIGLRIVKVRHQLFGVRMTKRFGVVVSIRDTRGKRIRGAIVSVGRVPGSQNTVTGIQATFSNKLGQARLVVPVSKQLFGKRVFLKIAARTPGARAIALRSVFLPKLG